MLRRRTLAYLVRSVRMIFVVVVCALVIVCLDFPEVILLL